MTSINAPIVLKDRDSWGCPVSVLEGRVQSSSKDLPKWEPRARIGACLERSPLHVGNLALSLNPSSEHVSPQYYVIFDDECVLTSCLRTNAVLDN